MADPVKPTATPVKPNDPVQQAKTANPGSNLTDKEKKEVEAGKSPSGDRPKEAAPANQGILTKTIAGSSAVAGIGTGEKNKMSADQAGGKPLVKSDVLPTQATTVTSTEGKVIRGDNHDLIREQEEKEARILRSNPNALGIRADDIDQAAQAHALHLEQAKTGARNRTGGLPNERGTELQDKRIPTRSGDTKSEMSKLLS